MLCWAATLYLPPSFHLSIHAPYVEIILGLYAINIHIWCLLHLCLAPWVDGCFVWLCFAMYAAFETFLIQKLWRPSCMCTCQGYWYVLTSALFKRYHRNKYRSGLLIKWNRQTACLCTICYDAWVSAVTSSVSNSACISCVLQHLRIRKNITCWEAWEHWLLCSNGMPGQHPCHAVRGVDPPGTEH